MNIVRSIQKDLRKDEITSGYASKNRYIPQYLYEKLKKRRVCDFCHKPISGLPMIHHKVAVIDGGLNVESNLMAVHKDCHRKLDALQDEERKKVKV